jgi:CelD/BcsL family acetyltransferase involved in cellulose biosynthesis
MVDIGATGRTARAADRNAGAGIASLKSQVDVRPADAAALAEYEAFCASALYAPPQHPVWVRAWIGATQADAFVATVGRDGRVAVALGAGSRA